MMSNTELDNEEEKPLDPEMEKVRKKMVRLLAVSLGIMFLGVMAVLVGVVYKVVGNDEGASTVVAGSLSAPADGPLEVRAALPDGFRVERVSLDGSNILFYGRSSGGVQQALIFDIAAERLAAQVTISGPD